MRSEGNLRLCCVCVFFCSPFVTTVELQGEIEACVRASGVWTRDKDAALVQYLNDKADDVGKPVVSLPASDLRPTREQFAFKYDVLDDIPLQSIHLRFAVIRLLNYK